MQLQPKVGETYLFKVHDEFWLGRVEAADANWVRLSDCSWIGSTGRLSEFIATGKTAQLEQEYFGPWTLQYTAFGPWPHKLLTASV